MVSTLNLQEEAIQTLQLTGDRILIQLDKHPEHTITKSGIVTPLFENIESDGGRPMAIASNKKYLHSGTVLDASPYAYSKLQELSTPVKSGDKVYINSGAVSQSYHFALNRDSLVYDFDGIISIPHTLLEAIIITPDAKQNKVSTVVAESATSQVKSLNEQVALLTQQRDALQNVANQAATKLIVIEQLAAPFLSRKFSWITALFHLKEAMDTIRKIIALIKEFKDAYLTPPQPQTNGVTE